MSGYLDLARTLIQRLESCRLTGYADSGGKPTIGWGHTGPEVRVGQTITQEIADHDLDSDLARADTRLAGVCTAAALAGLQDHQHAALVSFVFNVGANSSWTIWKDINNGNLGQVPAQLRRFDKGVVDGALVGIPGLDHRREAEVAFWNTADVEIAVAAAGPGIALAPPSHATVAMSTPPTPVPAPPMAPVSLAAKVTTAVGGGIAYVAAQGQQIHDVVSPYASNAKVFSTIDTVALGAVVAAGIVGVLIHAHQAQQRKV